MVWWWAALAWATDTTPRVVLSWAGDLGVVEVWAPLDAEVALDAPATVELVQGGQTVRWDATGARLVEGARVGVVRGAELTGTLSVSMCEKKSGTCTPARYALAGWTTSGRRGEAVLQVEPAGGPTPGSDHHPWGADSAAIADAAFTAARTDGRRVILDFGAVWCPPCNLMAAELLEAAEPPGVLDSFHVAALDADDPTSFALKDQYGVTGYPTLVVALADGTEVSRLVGYPGREETIAWMARAASQDGPDTNLAAIPPESVDPGRAAEIAWLLTRDGKPGVEAWLARAAEAGERVELHLARVSMQPNLDDARWLAEHAPGRAGDWVYAAKELAQQEEGRAILRRALEHDLRGARGPDAADLLYLLAETATEADQPLLYAAAAVALRTGLSGVPERDRGHYTWLAVLVERSGDLDGALELLRGWASRWPDEPTFHLALAGTLSRNERYDEALEAATAGLPSSWGDNRLRMARTACEALVKLDRKEEASKLATTTLAEVPPPAEGLDVRTWKYRDQLKACGEGTSG